MDALVRMAGVMMMVIPLGIAGCSRHTEDLWKTDKLERDDFKGHALAIQYLEDGERVAVLPPPGKLHSNGIAIIYRMPKDFPGLQEAIRSVDLVDEIRVQYATNKIDGRGDLRLEFANGKVYSLTGTPAVVMRSMNEVHYHSDKITFKRRAFFYGVPKSDFEKSMRIPLTPIAITKDLGSLTFEVTAAVVIAPLWVPLAIGMSGHRGAP